MTTLGAFPSETTIDGTYTPTLTNVSNLSASTAYACQWMRVGSVVTVSGRVNVTPTATSAGTELGISLPVASTFASAEQCGGTGHDLAAIIAGAAGIAADTANNRAKMLWETWWAGAYDIHFSFTYKIV